MRTTQRELGTYYDRTREERIAYQKAYYQRTKHEARRKRELEAVLDPVADALRQKKKKETCTRHYLAHRERILAQRKEQYQQRKGTPPSP